MTPRCKVSAGFGPLYDYTVESVNEVGDAITQIMLKPEGRSLRPTPGHFIYVSFDADAGNKEPHTFSISILPASLIMKSNAARSHAIEKTHALSGDQVLRKLDSTPEGLSAGEAAKRLEAVGPNRLPEPPKEGLLKRFFKHFHDLLIYILIAAAVVTAALGHWVDTGVIMGVVIINAIIGFIQEGKAEQALAGIRRMLSVHAHARRGSDWAEIEADDLVPGDIVRLRSGDRVPADLRLIDAVNLRLEESALTGESVPAEKKSDPAPADAGVGDRHCMAYSGTMVTATGSDTELGRINQMMSEVETLATPLTRQMNRFGNRGGGRSLESHR